MHPHKALIEDSAGDTTENEIVRLVQNLSSLEAGERALTKLVEYGGQAIGPLKRFLFEGAPSVVHQPRRWAVEALAAIGAKDALIQFLKLHKDISDPAVRLSEELVEDSAAKAVASWPTSGVFETLMGCAIPHPRLGLVEALGAFSNIEAIPYFISALGDDACRSAAEDALRNLGSRAEIALLTGALTRIPPDGEESTASLKRRIGALELLSELGPPPTFWALLRPLIDDPNSAIVIAACDIAARIGSGDDHRAATSRLLAVLCSADWFAQGKIENCLVALYTAGKEIIDREIARRNAAPTEQRSTDRVLRTLLRVRHRTNEALTA